MGLLDSIKWYSTFFYLLASVLSFTDSITDILMAIEFFRTDHKTWFGVVLTFFILPCLLLPIVQFFYFSDLTRPGFGRSCVGSCLHSLHPFSAAWANFKVFILCLKNFKKLWRGEGIDVVRDGSVDNEGFEGIEVVARNEDVKDTTTANFDHEVVANKGVERTATANVEAAVESGAATDQGSARQLTEDERLIVFSKLASYVEASVESAPQFIVQLYAMSIQQEPVETIQVISLPISFLSLTWAYTTSEGVFSGEGVNFDLMNFKEKAFYFVLNLLSLSSRLLAIAYFIVSYKWWIICIMAVHAFIMTGVFVRYVVNKDLRSKLAYNIFHTLFGLLAFGSLYWLKACACVIGKADQELQKSGFSKLLNLSNFLFVIENYFMIFLFYFCSNFSNTWYALPVTLYVCILSIVSVVMKIIIAIYDHQHQRNRIEREATEIN